MQPSTYFPLADEACTIYQSTTACGPPNEQSTSPFFRVLPPELRLTVYGFILAGLRSGTEDIKGALLSSKKIKTEIEAELPRAFLENLTSKVGEVQNKWESHTAAALQIASPILSADSRFDTMDLTVSIQSHSR
jgi:hypothetical protein